MVISVEYIMQLKKKKKLSTSGTSWTALFDFCDFVLFDSGSFSDQKPVQVAFSKIYYKLQISTG